MLQRFLISASGALLITLIGNTVKAAECVGQVVSPVIERETGEKLTYWSSGCHVDPLRIHPSSNTEDIQKDGMLLRMTPFGDWHSEYFIEVGPEKACWRIVYTALGANEEEVFSWQAHRETSDRSGTRFISESGRARPLELYFAKIKAVSREVRNIKSGAKCG
ncbi:hypothetical protein [Phaeobacter inhibens]|uniref:hypothetical protein n=1 Tax=Phaeobacter inhibens TaxID=221822 RepID=UPI000CA3A62A|nr:hypothetical protein [Phaeobacter inhibens]AUQ55738.1 hypothetical protein PhaeoP92_03100 [Phaeobacter inhibens]AUQ79754.1 hypothetical protein PhaeoP74_03101 [Phaeobacter inhibens]AUR16913.1 hypothetical protein PhaeoP70_03099 [Phaeobacter inhibens]